MTIHLENGPSVAPAIIAQALSDLQPRGGLLESLRRAIAPPFDKAAQYPVPLCVLTPDQLDADDVLATAPRTGWRYVALQGDVPVLVDMIETETGPAFAQMLTGSGALAFLTTLSEAETASDGATAQAAAMIIPVLQREALWLGLKDASLVWELGATDSPCMKADEFLARMRDEQARMIMIDEGPE